MRSALFNYASRVSGDAPAGYLLHHTLSSPSPTPLLLGVAAFAMGRRKAKRVENDFLPQPIVIADGPPTVTFGTNGEPIVEYLSPGRRSEKRARPTPLPAPLPSMGGLLEDADPSTRMWGATTHASATLDAALEPVDSQASGATDPAPADQPTEREAVANDAQPNKGHGQVRCAADS